MAGIKVSEEVVNKFNEMKFVRGGMKYITCKLSNDLTEVVVDAKGASTATWEDMESQLTRNECRYIFFNFDYEEDEGKR